MRTLGFALALLAVAAATAATLPLHELEADRGHEHCGSSSSPAVGHECHDHEHCVACALLDLPHACQDLTAPAVVLAEAAREPGASRTRAPRPPDRSSVSARAPPTA